MKALFFKDDLYMGSMEIEQIKPDIQFPVSQDLSGMNSIHKSLEKPFNTPSNGKTFVKLTFRLEDRGRNHAIYYLSGFEE